MKGKGIRARKATWQREEEQHPSTASDHAEGVDQTKLIQGNSDDVLMHVAMCITEMCQREGAEDQPNF